MYFFEIATKYGMLHVRKFNSKPLSFLKTNNQIQMYIDGLVQDCSYSIANALELQQSCTKSSIHIDG